MAPVLEVAIDCRMALHSGIGVVIRNVVSELVRSHPDWRFRFMGPPSSWVADRPIGKNILEIPMTSPIYSVSEQFELRRAAAGANVLWSPHYNAGVLASVPLVVTIHDLTHLAIKEFTRLPHKRLYAELMYRSIAAKASKLLFVSEFSQREFERLIGRPKGAAMIAHNGVAEDWFSTPVGPTPIKGDYLVYVGNVKPHKNLPGLLRAMELVRETRDVSLVIVGKIEGFITGDADASNAVRAQDWVRVIEGASDQELRAIVAGAQALVLPSLYEGFGLPPVEAMAIGCPAIVSNTASMPEICGDAAAYFDPHDAHDISRAILAVLDSPTLTSTLIEGGRQRAKKFSWHATAAIVGLAIQQAARR